MLTVELWWAWVVGGSLGVCMGLLLVLNGWSGKEPALKLELRHNSRVRSLLWGVGVVMAIEFGAWPEHLPLTASQQDELFKGYLLFYPLGFFIILLAATIQIFIEYRKSGEFGYSPIAAAGDFLYFGRQYVEERFSKRKEQEEDCDIQNIYEELCAVSEAFSQSNHKLADDLLRFERAISQKDDGRRRELMRTGLEVTLASIGDVFSDVIPAPVGREKCVNLMVAVPVGPDEAKIEELTPFKLDGDVSCTHLLKQLCRDTGSKAPEPRVLPVVDEVDEDKSLPGAPITFATGQTQVIVRNAIDFPSGLPEETKTKVNKYYKDQKFSTAVSLCVVRQGQEERRTIGVVNIHSNLAELLSDDGGGYDREQNAGRIAQSVLETVVAYTEDALAPFLVLVGMFADQLENGEMDG